MTEMIETKKFENGFELILVNKPGFSKKFAGIIVDYGSSDLTKEDLAYAGSAHFLEHKLFAKQDGDISEAFEENGANVNAFTSVNETMYYAVFVDNLEKNLQLLFKLIGEPFFTEENVAKEREIIVQELRMYQDEPYWRLNQALMNNLYQNEPLSLDIAGSEESLARISPASLLAIYRKYYTAEKMKLVIAGDVHFANIVKAVAPLVNALPVTTTPMTNPVFDQTGVHNERITLTGKTAHPRLIIGLKLPDFKQFLPSNDLMQTLIEIMLDSKFGELSTSYHLLQQDELLQQEPYLSVSYTRQGNYAKIMAQTDQPDEVVERLLTTLNDGEFSKPIFELQKKELIAKSFRTMDAIDNLAIEVAESRIEDEDYLLNVERLQQITYEQYVELVSAVMAQTRVTVAVLEKEQGES